MCAGSTSGGTFEVPILITPRCSLVKSSGSGVVAPSPEITGRSPPGPGMPRTTIGAAAVPARPITHFSR